jgi:transcription-repair coupling factor (superfamily II helicase)
MEIRGAGNLLGAEQSGFISDIGFELYQRILDEAVQELKEEEFAELFASDAAAEHVDTSGVRVSRTSSVGSAVRRPTYKNEDLTVDVDGDAMLPKTYIQSDVERYEFYKKLFRSANEEELNAITSELRDRFGALPHEALGLLDAVRLRIAGLPTGFGHIALKGKTLLCEFPTEDNVRFYSTMFQPMIAALSQMTEVKLVPKGKKVFVEARAENLEVAIALLHLIVERTQKQFASTTDSINNNTTALTNVGNVAEMLTA